MLEKSVFVGDAGVCGGLLCAYKARSQDLEVYECENFYVVYSLLPGFTLYVSKRVYDSVLVSRYIKSCLASAEDSSGVLLEVEESFINFLCGLVYERITVTELEDGLTLF